MEKADKKNKITTQKQWDKILKFMSENPDIGRGKPKFGSSKTIVNEKFEQLAVELNSVGPPHRTGHEWQRVWINYKGNLKRKLSKNRENYSATGGGPSTESSLNDNEKQIMEIINLEKQVEPEGVLFGVALPKRAEDMPDIENSESPINFSEDEELPSTSKRLRRKSAKKVEDLRLEYLKKQDQNQNKILEAIKKIESTSYKNYVINKKILELKTKKYEEERAIREVKKQYYEMKYASRSKE